MTPFTQIKFKIENVLFERHKSGVNNWMVSLIFFFNSQPDIDIIMKSKSIVNKQTIVYNKMEKVKTEILFAVRVSLITVNLFFRLILNMQILQVFLSIFL